MALTLNEKQVALAVGSFAAVMHTFWSILVASGYAQAFADWLIGLHFVTPTIQVGLIPLCVRD